MHRYKQPKLSGNTWVETKLTKWADNYYNFLFISCWKSSFRKTPFEIFWPFKDIRDGNLKAILGLFFQLSRFKQQQKILAQERSGTQQKLIAQERSGTPKIPSVPPSPARWKDWTILTIFAWKVKVNSVFTRSFGVHIFKLDNLASHLKKHIKKH